MCAIQCVTEIKEELKRNLYMRLYPASIRKLEPSPIINQTECKEFVEMSENKKWEDNYTSNKWKYSKLIDITISAFSCFFHLYIIFICLTSILSSAR